MVAPADSSNIHSAEHKHPWHLVDPSAWPILGAFSGGVLAVGAVIYMHGGGGWLLVLGLLAVLGVMAGWFADVVKEATHQGYHTRPVQISMRYGMVLFIASEVMFFCRLVLGLF